MSFHLESLWGATLMPHRGCTMDWGKNEIVTVGKNSGPVLSRLWTKRCYVGNAIASGGLKWQYIVIIATFSSCL